MSIIKAGPALGIGPPSDRLAPTIFGPIIDPQMEEYTKYYIWQVLYKQANLVKT